MPIFRHDGLRFNYREVGKGIPFVFQHGLGGDIEQPFGLVRPPSGFRMIAFDCRVHGATKPVGEERKIDIGVFVEDCASLLDHLHVSAAIMGGISMGAAMALEYALRYPERVQGLVLSRPAWLDKPHPKKANPFLTIARLIRKHGAHRGAELLKVSTLYKDCLRKSPDVAASLIKQFAHPRAEETVAKLERIPQYVPSFKRKDLRAISVPTLVLANRQDPVHPYEFGKTLARLIPGAEFRELTPKSASIEAHGVDVQRYIAEFLLKHFARHTQRKKSAIR